MNALDTNIYVYAIDADEPIKQAVRSARQSLETELRPRQSSMRVCGRRANYEPRVPKNRIVPNPAVVVS